MRGLCVALLLVIAVTAEDRAAVEVGSPIVIPLEPSVDEHRRSILLMSLKEKWSTTALLEEGSAVGTGSVPLNVEILSSKHLATYYGTIEIYGRHFKVLFDTGSCEFWVPSKNCNTERCKKHARLKQTPTMTIKEKNGLNIQYLSGKVSGDMCYETVKLGDIEVRNQVVGLGNTVDIELLDDVRWDGIMGLAYPNNALSARGVTPIFDTIMASHILTDKHLSNQFAYYISDTKGSVTFGGADCDLIAAGQAKGSCINQFKFVPVTERTYWTITIKDVRVKHPNKPEQKGFCGASGCKSIVDTGTYLIYGPETQVNKMGLASLLTSCTSHMEMPTFTFDFHVNSGDEAVSLELQPADYILKFNVDGRDDCVVGISPDKDTIWTLGQVFLRSFYTVFDRDVNRIGFARLPRTTLEAVNRPDVMKVAQQRLDDEQKRKNDAEKAAAAKERALPAKPAAATRPVAKTRFRQERPKSRFARRMQKMERRRVKHLHRSSKVYWANFLEEQDSHQARQEEQAGPVVAEQVVYDGLRHARIEP